MPLRDHFHSPLDDETSWEGFHGGWPMMIVAQLARTLPPNYVAAPRVHLGTAVEIDVATYEKDPSRSVALSESIEDGGVATAVWAPPQPTFAVDTDLPAQDAYEVRIYDARRGRRLVAAIEIVSPSNKDRPENRRAFISKCVAMLENHVYVAIVDLVTSRHFNLYSEMLDSMGKSDPNLSPEPPDLYAAACRSRRIGETWRFETWTNSLTLGQPLPTLPLWLADDLAVPLDLESSYEETCRLLRIA